MNTELHNKYYRYIFFKDGIWNEFDEIVGLYDVGLYSVVWKDRQGK